MVLRRSEAHSEHTAPVGDLVVNALIVLLEVIALAMSVAYNGGIGAFVYYTQLANFVGLVASVACLVVGMRPRGTALKAWHTVRTLKHAAVAMLLMTFFVVAFVLVPMMDAGGQDGFRVLFVESPRQITHFVCPFLACVSYLVWEARPPLSWRASQLGLLLTFVYAVVAYTMNYLRIWDGPYPFFKVWDLPVASTVLWFVVLLLLAEACCVVPAVAARVLDARSRVAR